MPGHGRWPQISRIYRAPHAAPPSPSPPPSFSLRLHLHLPCCHRRQNMTARRGQSGHSLRRSRGGNSAQFSWFQGGCVRLFFITACGEVSFTKIRGLRGATLLTCWKNSIFSFLAGVSVIAFSPPSCSALLFPSIHLSPFLSAPSKPVIVGNWVGGSCHLCLCGLGSALEGPWEGGLMHLFSRYSWTPTEGNVLVTGHQPQLVKELCFVF